MRVGFFFWPGAFESGHVALQSGLLEGLLAQEEHSIIVISPEPQCEVDVNPPHQFVSYRRAHGLLNTLTAYDLAIEVPAAALIRRLDIDALIAWANWPMPRVTVPVLAVLHETDFLEPCPWNFFTGRMLHLMSLTLGRNLKRATAVFTNSEYTASRA